MLWKTDRIWNSRQTQMHIIAWKYVMHLVAFGLSHFEKATLRPRKIIYFWQVISVPCYSVFFLRYKIYSNHLKQFESLTLTYFVSYIGKLLAWAHRSRLSVRLTLVNILFAINIYICLMSKTKSWYEVHYVERRLNIAAFVYRHTNINHHEGKCDNLHIIKVLFDHKNLLCKVTI